MTVVQNNVRQDSQHVCGVALSTDGNKQVEHYRDACKNIAKGVAQ